MSSLADAVYRIRTRRRETMGTFAARLGVGQSIVSRYESGKVTPPRSKLLLLLQCADSDEERRPILKALGISEDLQEGWDETLSEEIRSFDIYTEARKKDQAKKLPDKGALTEFAIQATFIVKELGTVDRSLVNILAFWGKYYDLPGAADVFSAAELALGEAFAELAPTSSKAKAKAKGK